MLVPSGTAPRNHVPKRLLLCLLFCAASAPLRAQDGPVRLGERLTFKPYVLLQGDEAGFRQSRPGGQAAGFNARRLRVGGRLEIAEQVEVGFIWDFGHTPGDVQRIFEAQVSYIGLKPFRITAGIFKPNYSLEGMQGAGDYLFLERASIVTATRNRGAGIRREGVQVQADGDRYIASVALTAGQAGPGRDGNQRAVVARVAGLPVRDPDLTVHVGISGQYIFRPARDTGAPRSVSLSEQTELRIDDVPTSVSTRAIEASSAGVIGPELGIAWRRLWLQGEYYAVPVKRRAAAGGGTPTFDGWYAQAAYTVLGRPRQWGHANGTWGAPKPEAPFDARAGEFGAVELGARFSTIDLDVRGGRQNVVSAGVNWWPIEPVRVSLMYEHADVSGGRSPRSLDAVAGRVQLQF